MKIKFIKDYQFGRFSFLEGQEDDIYKAKAEELIINKIAVPMLQQLINEN